MKYRILLLILFFTTALSAADIALVTVVCGDEYKDTVKIGTESKRKYCNQQGYDFICIEENLDPSRELAWSKILAVLKVMENPKYKWVFWVDADSIIMNTAIRVEDLIDEKYDFIINEDCNGLNAGVFLIRNCNAAKKFLQGVYDRPDARNFAWADTDAIEWELKDKKEFATLTKKVPQRLLNSYPAETAGNNIAALFHDGDFIIHFASLRGEQLRNLFEKYGTQTVCDPTQPNLSNYLAAYSWIVIPQGSAINESFITSAQKEQFNEKLRSYSKIRKILEIGLNAGHSADNFMSSITGLEKFVSFDNNWHGYTSVALDYLKRRHKRLFQFVEGDTKKTLPDYACCGSEKFDLIFIDGDTSFEGRIKDIINCEALANRETIIWINDTDNPNVKEAIEMAERTGLLRVLAFHRSYDDWSGERAWAECKYNF